MSQAEAVGGTEPRTRALTSPSTIAVTRVLVLSLGLATSPLVARAVGPDGRGVATAALAAMAIVPVLVGMGSPVAVRRRSSIEDPARVVRGARRLTLALLPPAICLGLALDSTVFAGLAPLESVFLVFGVASAPAFVLVLCDQSVLISGRRYGGVAALQAASPLVTTVVIVTGWFGGFLDVAVVLLATGLGNVLAVGVGGYLLRVPLRGPAVPARSIATEGTRYALSQIAEVSSSRMDQIMVLPLLGAVQAGYYAVGVTVSGVTVGIGHAIGAVMFRDVAVCDEAGRRQLFERAVRSSLAVGTVAMLVLAVVSPWAVPFVYGGEFTPSVAAVLICLAGVPFLVTNYVLVTMLGAAGRGRAMSTALLPGLVVGLALLAVLGPVAGAVGAAMASVVGYAVTFVICLVVMSVRWTRTIPLPADLVSTVRVLLGVSARGAGLRMEHGQEGR